MNTHKLLALIMPLVLLSCVKRAPIHPKVQSAQVEKLSELGAVPRIKLTEDARRRLAIKSLTFPQDQNGKRTIPISALLYDTSGIAWVFVETPRLEFHREQIRILQTLSDQILVASGFSDSVPVVIQGAAELIGTESGVGK